jgi:SAM-dependent methyltransferase
MDAMDRRYEDASFDGIFSSGSIEHFGELEDIRRSVAEMHRVLKPGGVAALATEFRLEGPERMPGTVFFDEQQLRSTVLDGLDWELASPLDLTISEATLASPIDFGALIAKMPKPPRPSVRKRLGSLIAGGGLAQGLGPPAAEPETRYPHIVLRYGEHLWTSVHLALIKPG